MFGLTILSILILCEPLLCLARPQYFCCLPCPLTNDCENPYYREPPLLYREEPPSFPLINGNLGGRADYDGLLPKIPLPPLQLPSRPRAPRPQYPVPGHSQAPDPNCINLIIKCNDDKEAYEDPYNNAAEWFRGKLPDGQLCWVLQCNDPSSKVGGNPSPNQHTPAPRTPPPQMPPQQSPPTPAPSKDSPPPENSNNDPNARLFVHCHDTNLPKNQHNHIGRQVFFQKAPGSRTAARCVPSTLHTPNPARGPSYSPTYLVYQGSWLIPF